MYVPSLGMYIPKLGIKLSPQRKDFLTTVQEQYQCSLTINVEQALLSAENGQKKARSKMTYRHTQSHLENNTNRVKKPLVSGFLTPL